MSSLFVDVNVLLEMVLPGRRYANQAVAAIAGQQTAISPLSAHLLVHFGRKERLPINDLLAIVESYQITDFGSDEVAWAIRHRQSDDFEDALQVACAVSHGCRTFITFDGPLSRRYGQFIDMRRLPD